MTAATYMEMGTCTADYSTLIIKVVTTTGVVGTDPRLGFLQQKPMEVLELTTFIGISFEG